PAKPWIDLHDVGSPIQNLVIDATKTLKTDRSENRSEQFGEWAWNQSLFNGPELALDQQLVLEFILETQRPDDSTPNKKDMGSVLEPSGNDLLSEIVLHRQVGKQGFLLLLIQNKPRIFSRLIDSLLQNVGRRKFPLGPWNRLSKTMGH